jgi:Phage integrase, N-terminal SAM-like domain
VRPIIKTYNLNYTYRNAMNDEIDQFWDELRRQQLSTHSIENYASDLRVFARFFHGSTGEPFQATRIPPTDTRGFKSHLAAVVLQFPLVTILAPAASGR